MSWFRGIPEQDPYVDFSTMTRARAKAYLGRFVEEMDACHDRLVATAAATGGPGRDELDFSRESLDPLWEWAAPRCAWRAGYVLPPRGSMEVWDLELEPASELPSWFHQPSGIGMDRLDRATLWLADGVGRYFGEVLRRHVEGVRWGTGSTRPRNNWLANMPVLVGLFDEMCPVLDATGRAVLVLTDYRPDPPPLTESFDRWADVTRRSGV